MNPEEIGLARIEATRQRFAREFKERMEREGIELRPIAAEGSSMTEEDRQAWPIAERERQRR